MFEAVKNEKKIKTIGLLGKNGGRLLNEVDFSITVNSQRTAEDTRNAYLNNTYYLRNVRKR